LRDQFKVLPAGALGYSLGEMTMMFGTGVWAVADNNSELVGSSPLFRERLSGPQNAVREFWHLPPATPQDRTPIWAIFVLKTAVSTATAAVEQPDRVYLTHINAPNEVVIAGDPQRCMQVVQAVGCDYIPEPYNHVLHCELMQPEWAEFARLNTIPVDSTPAVDFYYAANNASPALTSEAIANNIATASYQQVDFPGLVQRAYDDGVRVFLELGPRAACTWWIQDILDGQPHLSAAVNRRSLDDHTMLVQLLAQLVSHRVPLDLSSLVKTAAVETVPGRSLVRTVSLTKTPIREMMLTTENKEIFAQVALKPKPVQVAPPVLAAPPVLIAPPIIQTEPILEESMTKQTNLVPEVMMDNDGVGEGETAVSFTFLDEQLQKLDANMGQSLRVHETFLNMRAEVLQQMRALVEMQIEEGGIQRKGAKGGRREEEEEDVFARNRGYSERSLARVMPWQDLDRANSYSQPDEVIWGPDALEGYAGGSIVPMFGEEYAIIDTYRRR
ncbi:MAG: hypothetical protein GY942_18580, partial [Aestuariibacter sp.]|nr:hypothetical protein [Aestuariibacter sp.]